MKLIRVILIAVVLLCTVSILAGCPPTAPPSDEISAKEAWDIMKSAKETVSDDAVPVYIEGSSTISGIEVKDGKAPVWKVGFYSEGDNAVWEVVYFAQSAPKLSPFPGEKRYSDVSLTVNDLSDLKIDSPEACAIAVQNGAAKTPNWVRLRIARLDVLGKEKVFETPSFIPESTKLFWVISAGGFYYIDACTGEYLGIITLEQLDKIED